MSKPRYGVWASVGGNFVPLDTTEEPIDAGFQGTFRFVASDARVKFQRFYPQRVLNLIEQCHSSGFPVVCDRLACGYYRVSLHGEDVTFSPVNLAV